MYIYEGFKEKAEHYTPEVLTKALDQRHMDSLWEKGEYLKYLGNLYHSCFNWLGHNLHLDPHTLEVCATALAAAILAYLLFKNRKVIFKVVHNTIKSVVKFPFAIIYAIFKAGKMFFSSLSSFLFKKAKQNVIKQAIQTQNKKVIILACKL